MSTLYRINKQKSKFILFFFLLLPLNFAFPFAYIFAESQGNVDLVAHPSNYLGTGGTVVVQVGIDPSSVNAALMVVPTQNVINIYNSLSSTTGNLVSASLGGPDFESVLLHEMGHSLGLAHCNAASESGLSGANQDFTKALVGSDTNYTLVSGADLVIGSSDDFRGDDENLSNK